MSGVSSRGGMPSSASSVRSDSGTWRRAPEVLASSTISPSLTVGPLEPPRVIHDLQHVPPVRAVADRVLDDDQV
jgi:hypothetical protein